jgi:ABC-type lipopolysaccharide export system ATPase subunit
MHVLEVKGIKKNYNGKKIVSDINLYINSGEVVGLLGPNGAGKISSGSWSTDVDLDSDASYVGSAPINISG